jgi:gluconate 2-dehydrogenase gamma chain
MDRRELLQRAALVLGYAITGPSLTGILNGCTAKPDLTYKPDFFNDGQAALISEVAEIILPRTTTPGAKDAGVPAFIDGMVKEVFPQKDRDAFMKGLADFDEDAKKTYGDPFIECSPENRTALVKKHHDAAIAQIKERGLASWYKSADNSNNPFIMKVKELTILGFFTSEPGATQVLQYNAVPGPFKGCVPLAEAGGKQWAT